MERSYEELLKYKVYEAIKLKGEKKDRYIPTSPKELHEYLENDPMRKPNNPLLLDYDWVYEHAEELFCENMFNYQQFQGVEAYYTLFKALTAKYPIDEDYYNHMANENYFSYKWGFFAIKFVEFFAYSFDERLEQLLEKEDFINYFLNHPLIYTHKIMEGFGSTGMKKLLEYNQISSYYTKNYKDLIQLIRNHPMIKIPLSVMMDKNIIKNIARTPAIEELYFNLHFILEQCSGEPYIEEHKKYCDEQVSNTKNGILPCLQTEYQKADDEILKETALKYPFMRKQVIERIFKNTGLDTLPKKYLYQELSKYMITGMFISRNYETDPYNLLIDIETLHKFAQENNRILQGQDICDFLVSFESKNVFETIQFYQKNKSLPLMEILYDDWQNQKYTFIEEINSKSMKIDQLEIHTNENGITYYDITDLDSPILVNNTSVLIYNQDKIDKMIEQIKKGAISTISLSLQDKKHQVFYNEEETKPTIKFAFSHLMPNKVGIIYHQDAYSTGANSVESDNYRYTRKLYTVKSFMESTISFNEIAYVVNNEPFLPIGIICENEITQEEIKVAEELNIPILFRKSKNLSDTTFKETPYEKRYQYTLTKSLFLKR